MSLVPGIHPSTPYPVFPPLCPLPLLREPLVPTIDPLELGLQRSALEDAPATACRRQVWAAASFLSPPTHSHSTRKVNTRAGGRVFFSVREFQRPWPGKTHFLEVPNSFGPFLHTSHYSCPLSPPVSLYAPLTARSLGSPPGSVLRFSH